MIGDGIGALVVGIMAVAGVLAAVEVGIVLLRRTPKDLDPDSD